ncbi:hypothetical protein HID58_049840, partial [Brassica napus]
PNLRHTLPLLISFFDLALISFSIRTRTSLTAPKKRSTLFSMLGNNNKREKLLVPLQTPQRMQQINHKKEQNNEEAERRCENPMKRANENSTDEAERLFKRPALMTTGNSICTSEAERLFKKPMEAAKPNSTSEAKRLFGFSRSL